MQALLDSFIQEIDKIDDVDELRRRLIALKKEQLELLNRESEHLRAQSETALLFQQAQDEAKGLRRENEEMRKKLEKLEAKDKLDTNRLFGRKTEKMDDILDPSPGDSGTDDPLSEDAAVKMLPRRRKRLRKNPAPGTAAVPGNGVPGNGRRISAGSRSVQSMSSTRKSWTGFTGRATGASSAGTGPRKRRSSQPSFTRRRPTRLSSP